MKNLEAAYNSSVKFARSHYENFPVVSFMVKKELRKHVAVIYRFAREADDLSDEGTATSSERIHSLEEYETRLMNALNGEFYSDYWECLANTISEKKLSPENFTNLISAFKQDTIKNRYRNYDELLDYCCRSANPVGRLILELNGINDSDALRCSDQICSALQITNFLQDVSVDLKKDRIYLPAADLEKFGVTESDFFNKNLSQEFTSLIKFETERVSKMFDEGSGLLRFMSGALRIQIKWTLLGGKRILEKIVGNDYNVLLNRPVISKAEYFGLFAKAALL